MLRIYLFFIFLITVASENTCNVTCINEYNNNTLIINCSVPPYFCSCWCNTYVGPVCSCMNNLPINFTYPTDYMKPAYILQNDTSSASKNKINYVLIISFKILLLFYTLEYLHSWTFKTPV